jgi:3-deoxy-D-manno-octulosonic-acid transferase
MFRSNAEFFSNEGAKIRKTGQVLKLSFAAKRAVVLRLYNFFIAGYSTVIRLAANWNKKAAAWVEGRKDVFLHLQKAFQPTDQVIWMHCSSAGEFEQGKPVIEALKKTYPAKKMLVTFFSPSGYGVAKGYKIADVISYLPLDTRKNADTFLSIIKPELVIFVKYEFWHHHLSVAAFHHVPVLLISAVFRPNQIFFRPYGRFFRQMLHLFRHIFVQDEASLQLLQDAGIRHCSIGGDSRFDRVIKITESTESIPTIEAFTAGRKVIVAGSTWPGDEAVLAQYLRENSDVKLIIAPHEIEATHISSVKALFPDALLFTTVSKWTKTDDVLSALTSAHTLIIDTIGLLSRLYRYATITYVGGGFTKDGIHNILEAAVWQKPVLFGPNYTKYREGSEMIAAGGACSFANINTLKRLADDLLNNEDHLQQMSLRARAYISNNTGATEKIMQAIQEKRLLTN